MGEGQLKAILFLYLTILYMVIYTIKPSCNPHYSSRYLTSCLLELSYLVSAINVAKITNGANSPENKVITRSLLYTGTEPVLVGMGERVITQLPMAPGVPHTPG